MKRFLSLALAFLLVCGAWGALAEGKTVDKDWPNMTWDEVLAEAKGQTVNWYMWGGSMTINNFVDNVIQGLVDEYGVKINRVGINNIVEAINLTLGEKQADKHTGGACDLYWINGSNFLTAKQGDILFGPWAEQIPNAVNVDWTDPSVAYDMGFKVDGYESPWMSAQFQAVYDSSRSDVATLPHNFAQLREWVKANPGRFTYLALPQFISNRFIKQGIYEMCGGYQALEKEGMTKEEFYQLSKPVWDLLLEIEPYLWREGKTYPQSSADLDKLFSDGEVDLSMSLNGAGISADIASGMYPEKAKVYPFDVSIADTNYVAIPYNSGAKAAAMVVANAILSAAQQGAAVVEISGGPGINVAGLSEGEKAIIMENLSKLPEGTLVPAEEQARTRQPEISSYLNPYIEELWAELIAP